MVASGLRARPSSSVPVRREPDPEQIHALLTRWQEAGLIPASSIARIEAAESERRRDRPPGGAPAEQPHGRSGGSLVAEALGYAGAALVGGATAGLVGDVWRDLPASVQASLTGVGSAGLLAAGVAVSGHLAAPAQRLRSMLWAASAALAFATWLLVGRHGLGLGVRSAVAVAAALTLLESLVMWAHSAYLPQHVVSFASAVTLAGVTSTFLPGTSHRADAVLAVVAVAGGWVLLGLRGVVRPRAASFALGCISAAVATQWVSDRHWGAILALAVAVAIVVFAVGQHSLVLLGIGTVALLADSVAFAQTFFSGSVAPSVALIGAGLALVCAALWMSRRSPTGRTGPHDRS